MDQPEPPDAVAGRTPAGQGPDQPPTTVTPAPDDGLALPPQSREDTDAGWGERPEPDDDERLYSDRPPHWET